jgi:RimJ/RimL family protein N-acetyltransferase
MSDLTCAQELFVNNTADIAVLSGMHWKELYGTSNGYCCDFPAVVLSEQNGGVAYFTLRDPEGKLAGHVGFMVYRNPFYGKLIAMDIFYYILPEFRGSLGMCKLLRFAGTTLRSQGVDQVVVSHQEGNNLSSILKRAGYIKAGETYFYEG